MKGAAHHRVSPPSAFPFESRFVTVGGHRIHYVKEGQHDLVLFLHGNPTSSYVFRNVLRGVAKSSGRCAIAMDLLDFGKSDKPNIDYSCSLHPMVSQWLNELGERRAPYLG